MKEYLEILKNVTLFKNINDNDLTSILSCLGAKVIRFDKDEFILTAGSKPEHIGIVLEGNVQIIKEDINGERILVAAVMSGNFFAESLACAGILESPVSVVSSSNSTIMLIEFNKILHTCPSSCTFHAKLIENMISIIARKNLMLRERVEIIGKKTLRIKILSYLESFAAKQCRNNITIPFNREELADFLCVDRSALSHELSRMKKDGILDYHKNNFKIMK